MSELPKKGLLKRAAIGTKKLLMALVYVAPLIIGLILIFMRTNNMNVKLGYWLLLAAVVLALLMTLLNAKSAMKLKKANFYNLKIGEGSFWKVLSMISYFIFIVIAVVTIIFYQMFVLGHSKQTDPPGKNSKILGLYYLTGILFGAAFLILSYIAAFKFGCLIEGTCSKESMSLSLLGIWLLLLVFILSFDEFNILSKVTDDF